MITGLVTGIILGVLAACILTALAYRCYHVRRQRRRTKFFYLPPPATSRSLGTSDASTPDTSTASIPPMPQMSEVPVPIVPYSYQNFASEVPVPVIPDTVPTTPLSDMFSPYTTTTTPFSDLTNPIVQKAAVRTPQVSQQPQPTISRAATELHLMPSPDTPASSRCLSPATVSSVQGSICETPVLGTAVAFNVSRESIPRYSMIRIDTERSAELSPPRTAYIPYRPPQD